MWPGRFEIRQGMPRYLCVCTLRRQRGWVEAIGDRRLRCWRRGRGRPSAAGRSGRKSSAAKRSGIAAGLRIDQLQFAARASATSGRVGLGADADPVDAGRRRQGAVGLDRDLEAAVRAARRSAAHRAAATARRRCRRRSGRRRASSPASAAASPRRALGACELAAAVAVGADEVGVAEAADGGGAVALAAAPEIAAGKAQKTAARPAWRALALQGVEDLLDRVGHRGGLPDGPSRWRAARRPGRCRSHSPRRGGGSGRRDSRCGCASMIRRPAPRRRAPSARAQVSALSSYMSGVSMHEVRRSAQAAGSFPGVEVSRRQSG